MSLLWNSFSIPIPAELALHALLSRDGGTVRSAYVFVFENVSVFFVSVYNVNLAGSELQTP